jgi:hypothetical protein
VNAKRGDRVAPPPVAGGWDLRFGTKEAATGWGDLCAHAPANTRRAWDAITTDPRPSPPLPRHHPLKGQLAHGTHQGRDLEQWQYEVTSGGRLWYLIDDERRTLWLVYASTAHPKATG